MMNPKYDDKALDALIAASLLPVRDEPTDMDVETCFQDASNENRGDDSKLTLSIRESLVSKLSGEYTPQSDEIEVAESQYEIAAMNRDNADDDFDEDTRSSIEEVRNKILEELRNKRKEQDDQ